MNKVCFNLLIFHGDFCLEVLDPREDGKFRQLLSEACTSELGPNTLIFNLKMKKFKYRLTKDINSWANNKFIPINIQIQKLIQAHLDQHSTNLKVVRVFPKLNNLHANITIPNCSIKQFRKDIVPQVFIKFAPIHEVKITQDGHESCITTPSLKSAAVKSLCNVSEGICFKDVQFKFITNSPKRLHSLTLKFQPNARQKKIHVTFIATSFNSKYQEICKFLEYNARKYSF